MPKEILRRGIIIPDLHAPYEDKRAWQLVLAVANAFKPEWIWVMGDFLDFYSVSRHSKDPRRARQLEDEIPIGLKRLDELDALGAVDKVFVAGNHEDRLRRYLQDKAPELFGVVSIPGLLGLRERGWHYVPYKDHRKVGKVHLTHDINGQAGRYSIFRLLDTFQHTVVGAHTHRLQYIVEGNAVGEQKLAATFGWLGDRNQIDYMSKARVFTDSCLGFGVGYLAPNGLAYLTPVPIVNYTCCVEGKLWRG